MEKKFLLVFFSVLCFIIIATSSVVIWLDPYFHFHGPADGISYVLKNQRYQNDGISRHFDYNAIITGTSMTENFRASQFDKLFKLNSIKTSYSGATFNEINNALVRAINYNPNIKMILRSLDMEFINTHKDEYRYENYPDYLYDNNMFNDINYLLNKDFLFGDFYRYCIYPTSIDYKMTSFDSYSYWGNRVTFSKEKVLNSYKVIPKEKEEKLFSDEDKKIISENIQQNVIQIAKDNPDIMFYYFIPPYSIAYYDKLNMQNKVNSFISYAEYACNMMVEYDNIKIFSFLNDFDVITDLDNYKDVSHYSPSISVNIIREIYENKNVLSKENIDFHFKEAKNFYINYDYESLRK